MTNLVPDSLYRLTLFGQTHGVQTTVAAFHYVTENNPDWVDIGDAVAYSEVVSAFQAKFTAPFTALLSNVANFSKLRIELMDKVEYETVGAEEFAISLSGGVSGEVLPPFVCYSFRYNRSVVNVSGIPVRHGYKRLAGVPESANFNGGLQAAYVTPANNVAAALQSRLVFEGLALTWKSLQLSPVLVSRTVGVGEATEKIKPVLITKPASAVFVRISTQNTRK